MWEQLQAASDPLLWLSLGGFLLAAVVEATGRRRGAVSVAGGAWLAFGAFWFSMVPHFVFEFGSPLESLLSLAAVPLCLLAGYRLYTGRESLLVLSRAIGVMGLLYAPFALYEPATRALIELVAVQSHWGMELVGYSPGLEAGANGYESRFAFEGYSTYVILACTGIGAISIFGGLVASVRAPLRRKVAAFALATGTIWFLNLARNVFIGLAAPLGWFDYPPLESLTTIFAGEGTRTSYVVSHHVIGQSLSVVALLAIAWLLVRLVPDVAAVLEEALYLLTGSEYDLAAAFDPADRHAGGER